MNWEDVRYIVAVHRAGTVSAAALRLGVDQTTVSRRLKAIEAELGQSLFNRGGNEMVPSDLCELIVSDGKAMELTYLNLSERLATDHDKQKSVVRISAMPWIVNNLLVPNMAEFLQANPWVTLDTVSSVRDRSRIRGEVDLSLRFDLLPGADDICRPIARVTYSIYAKKGVPGRQLPWIGYGGDMKGMAPARWVDSHINSISMSVNDAGAMLRAIESGVGKGLLPDWLAERSTGICSTSEQRPELTRILRLLVNPELVKLESVKSVVAWLQRLMAAEGLGIRGQ